MPGDLAERRSRHRAPRSSGSSFRVPIAFKFSAFIAALVVAFMLWQTMTAIRVAHSRLDSEINASGVGLVTAIATLIDPEWILALDEERQERLVSTLNGFARSDGAALVQVLNVVAYDASDTPVATARGERRFDLARGRIVESPPAAKALVEIRELSYEGQPVRSFSRPIAAAREASAEATSGKGIAGAASPGPPPAPAGRVELYVSAKAIEDSREELTTAMVRVSLAACLVATVSSFLLARFLTRHIRALVKDLRQVSQGDLDHQSAVRSSDELGDLARAFNIMTSGLQAAQEAKLAQQALDQELSIATKIQTGLLPATTPDLSGFDVASYYLSAKEVGGDYYDFLPIDDDHLGMVVADVSGKSVPGSLIMTMTRSLLRMASEGQPSPTSTVKIVNRFLTPDVSPGMFVTLLYFVLQRRTREIKLVRCGHCAPLLVSTRHRKTVRLQPEGIALCLDRGGSVFESELKMQRFVLAPGDVLVCYTDGVTEAKSRGGEDYTEDRLRRIVSENALGSARDLVEAIVKDLAQHQRGEPQSDDITLLVLKSC